MPRQKNDGRGRLGGRQKGTPNRENPLKGYIRAHSMAYFEPQQTECEDGKIRLLSSFDQDMLQLAPDDRVSAELRLLEFTQPKMKAMDVDLNASVNVHTIEDLLADLCSGEE